MFFTELHGICSCGEQGRNNITIITIITITIIT